jgi:hypothetical protein
MALQDYLDELFEISRPLSTSKLVNLSDLNGPEHSEFQGRWECAPVERRKAIIERLADLTEDNVELNFDRIFMAALGDTDAEVRVRSIRALWEYEGTDLVERLMVMLRADPDPGVRAEAATALGRFTLLAEFDELSPATVPQLDEALRGVIADPMEDVEVRARAIEAVGSRTGPWVDAIIRTAYEGKNQRLKVSALEAMGRNCHSQWLPLLLDELENEDPEVRFEAAGALAEIGDEAAVPRLLERIDDEDAEVQDTVIAALGAIGGRRSRSALERLVKHPNERIRDAAQEALDQVDFNDDPLSLRIKP